MRDVCLAPVSCLIDLISGKKRAGRGGVAARTSFGNDVLTVAYFRFRLFFTDLTPLTLPAISPALSMAF